jgi:beta-1,4-N-acetylglucosaminyltransferase
MVNTKGSAGNTAMQVQNGESAKMKLLVVLGEGGHTTELLRLIDLLGDQYEYHYMVTQEDNLSASRIRHRGPLYSLPRPRGKGTGIVGAVWRTLRAGLQSLPVIWRIQPAAILSTGPAIAVPVSLTGKLLGARIIFIETGSRVTRLSWTGRLVYRWADLFFVQWPQLAEKLPRAIYAGRLV